MVGGFKQKKTSMGMHEYFLEQHISRGVGVGFSKAFHVIGCEGVVFSATT